MLKDENELKEHITSSYQILFEPPEENKFTMMENRVNDIPQVSEIENEILITMFIENEVKEPIFQMVHNRAPGLDGFSTEFCQVFREVIKANLMTMFYILLL
jgi:hypothetical protein